MKNKHQNLQKFPNWQRALVEVKEVKLVQDSLIVQLASQPERQFVLEKYRGRK